MKIDLFFRHEDLHSTKHDESAIVIDVLRATTSIITALMNGANSVIPVKEPDEAFLLRREYNYLIAGERCGLTIDGFDFGNSPFEFTREKVEGRTIVFCTSNGTKAMQKTAGFAQSVLASFLNIQSVVDYIISAERDTVIICAGTLGEPSLEDTLCGGMIADMLKGNASKNAADAISIYRKYRNNIHGCMNDSHHGRYLIELGFERDLDFASQIAVTDAVPLLQAGVNGTMSARLVRQR